MSSGTAGEKEVGGGMKKTPQGMRLHIGIFGKRNVGKSSLLNALTGRQASIVSEEPGCTTDPVRKAMEFHPLGPVLFTDTAGVDDDTKLGRERVARSREILDSTDLALVLATADDFGFIEKELVDELKAAKTKVLLVFNKADQLPLDEEEKSRARSLFGEFYQCSAKTGQGIEELRRVIVEKAPPLAIEKSIASDLLPHGGGLAVLVVPIDLEAPKGRLILPQVQVIRDLLDGDSACLVVKERELSAMLSRLSQDPDLVITDSQAFLKVAADLAPHVALTSFSILFARLKGDLDYFIESTEAIECLQSGDRVLIAEACTHHPVGEDIGRVKIPRWLNNYVGGGLDVTHVQGRHFPERLDEYDLVIHCGACTFNDKKVKSRISACKRASVPMTNYGMTIAYVQGLFERAVAVFR